MCECIRVVKEVIGRRGTWREIQILDVAAIVRAELQVGELPLTPVLLEKRKPRTLGSLVAGESTPGEAGWKVEHGIAKDCTAAHFGGIAFKDTIDDHDIASAPADRATRHRVVSDECTVGDDIFVMALAKLAMS